jgi:SAM-dependent methyltransferase
VKHDAATLAFYAREAATYAARARKTESPELVAFLGQLKPGANVLDLGCGGGQDALKIKTAGFDVTAMDGSPELAAEAENRLGQTVRIQLFEDLIDVEAFDGVWANASLLHVPKTALAATIGRIHRALRPGGMLHASFKSGGVEGRDSLGRYYNHPSKDELAASLPRPDWEILEIAESEGPGYDGVITGWLTVLAQKPGPLAKDSFAR